MSKGRPDNPIREYPAASASFRRVDQASHEPRSGVRYWRLHSRCSRVRCVARGHLRRQRAHIRGEGEGRLCAANSERNLPGSQEAESCPCPFKNLPEKRASRWGEALTAEKMKECYWVKPKLVCQVAFVEWTDAGTCGIAPSSPCHKKPAEVVRET